jgi:predicted 3-demethylubiquinone-9 3-methyltransferase (glyoxalase superfamily)
MKMQKVTPFLWFNNQAEDAAKFYVSIFKNSHILGSNPMVTHFELEGMQILILNGGPTFQLTEAFSLSISCENQEEIDYFWSKLSEGGSESQCGWLKDKYGVSWQVVPEILSDLLGDPTKAERVTQAFLKMKKFDIQKLLNA